LRYARLHICSRRSYLFNRLTSDIVENECASCSRFGATTDKIHNQDLLCIHSSRRQENNKAHYPAH